MGIDFFNNDRVRGDNYASKESNKAVGDAGMQNEKPDLFKDSEEPKSEVELLSEAVLADEVVETAEESKEEIPTKKVEEPTKQVKELSSVFGDKSYNVPAEAKFKHKVDGSEVEVSLQELLNNYSGKQGWDKKFTELDKDRQTYKKELDQVNKYLNEFATKAKTDRIGAFEYLAEAAGLDPLEFRKAIRKDLLQANQAYLQMDEHSRTAFELKEENDYFKSKRELEQKRRSEEQTHKEFETRIQSTKQSHGISDERLQELVTDLRQYGGIERPSLDDVVNLHSAYIRQDRALDTLKKINPDLLKDESKIATLESLIAGNSKLGDKELEEYAAKLWGRSIKQAAPKPKAAKKQPQTPVVPLQKKVIGGGNFDFFK